MKNVIKITDKILGVIVPESAFDFNLCNSNIIDYWKDFEGGRSGEIELPEGTTYKDWKIHGTCTLQAFDFDFEPIMCKELTALIQNAIQDEGMYTVNPYGENRPQELVDYTGRKDGIIANSLDIERWQSAESKTVKKLLLIEKI